jgi:hypothetical protein
VVIVCGLGGDEPPVFGYSAGGATRQAGLQVPRRRPGLLAQGPASRCGSSRPAWSGSAGCAPLPPARAGHRRRDRAAHLVADGTGCRLPVIERHAQLADEPAIASGPGPGGAGLFTGRDPETAVTERALQQPHTPVSRCRRRRSVVSQCTTSRYAVTRGHGAPPAQRGDWAPGGWCVIPPRARPGRS